MYFITRFLIDETIMTNMCRMVCVGITRKVLDNIFRKRMKNGALYLPFD